MVICSATWLWALAFSDPAFEARHPGLPERCAWAAASFVAAFACLHFVYSFVALFQGLVAMMTVAMVCKPPVSKPPVSCKGTPSCTISCRVEFTFQ